MSEQTQAVAVRDDSRQHYLMQGAGAVSELVQQIALIHQVMKECMQEDVHFGTIPGCGDKKALYKPGAEKLSFIFRLAPEFEEQTIDLGSGHREVRVKCTLRKIGSSMSFGQGVGSCTTMEAKYRFRTGPKKPVDPPRAVPKEYWDNRKTNPQKAQELLGGKGYTPMKDAAGVWVVAEQGERIEHDNPGDHWNTVLKMAKKRAHVDAILTATAASDLFTQDDDDLDDDGKDERVNQNPKAPASNATSTGNQQPNGHSQEQAEEWREVSIHFGKDEGKKLGDLPDNKLEWYCEKWIPRPFPEGSTTIKASDLFLRRALNNAAIEMGFNTPR